MKIGNLRKRISVQSEQQTADGAGGYTLTWTTLATLWADIVPATGRELYTAGHLEGRVTHKITTRWRADLAVTSDMRIAYNTRVFNIHAVMNDGENNQWMILLVEEGAAL